MPQIFDKLKSFFDGTHQIRVSQIHNQFNTDKNRGSDNNSSETSHDYSSEKYVLKDIFQEVLSEILPNMLRITLHEVLPQVLDDISINTGVVPETTPHAHNRVNSNSDLSPTKHNASELRFISPKTNNRHGFISEKQKEQDTLVEFTECLNELYKDGDISDIIGFEDSFYFSQNCDGLWCDYFNRSCEFLRLKLPFGNYVIPLPTHINAQIVNELYYVERHTKLSSTTRKFEFKRLAKVSCKNIEIMNDLGETVYEYKLDEMGILRTYN
jgi:hypothetical protein